MEAAPRNMMVLAFGSLSTVVSRKKLLNCHGSRHLPASRPVRFLVFLPAAVCKTTRVVPFYPFLGEGSPTKLDCRKKGTLILTSLLEDLIYQQADPSSFWFSYRRPCARQSSRTVSAWPDTFHLRELQGNPAFLF